MSYNVVTIEPFDNELERLAQKYPSLKQEITSLFSLLETDPFTARLLAGAAIKSGLQLPQKGKVNPAVRGLLRIVPLLKQPFCFYPFMISLNRRI